MALSIYLDDCSDNDDVITFLQQAGYTAISPRDVGMRGADDPDHFDYAAQHGYILLTANPNDFMDLHADYQSQGRTHSGLLLVYYDNDPTKDMKPQDIVRAITHLHASGLTIANEVHTLNHWR